MIRIWIIQCFLALILGKMLMQNIIWIQPKHGHPSQIHIQNQLVAVQGQRRICEQEELFIFMII